MLIIAIPVEKNVDSLAGSLNLEPAPAAAAAPISQPTPGSEVAPAVVAETPAEEAPAVPENRRTEAPAADETPAADEAPAAAEEAPAPANP